MDVGRDLREGGGILWAIQKRPLEGGEHDPAQRRLKELQIAKEYKKTPPEAYGCRSRAGGQEGHFQKLSRRAPQG